MDYMKALESLGFIVRKKVDGFRVGTKEDFEVGEYACNFCKDEKALMNYYFETVKSFIC